MTTLSASADRAPFKWSKPEVSRLRDKWSARRLTLELVTTGHRGRGSMEIYRLYNERPLLIDINLLTSVFPVVLADALDRALTTPDVTPEEEMSRAFSAAKAS